MSNHWTKEQEDALNARGRNLLLSAAAGSGKTAVLTERITRLVTDPEHPVNINELLVLTFTKSAAAEMKARVSSSLTAALKKADEEHQEALVHHLEKQISLLGNAAISTLDSFFQSLVKQYFYLLDLDPKTKILSDENEQYLLSEEVLTEVLETFYQKGDPDFLDTADFFAGRYQDKKLRAAVRDLWNFSRSMAFPEVWLSRLPDAYALPENASLDDLPWTAAVRETLVRSAEKAADLYRDIFSLMENSEPIRAAYGEILSGEYDFFSLLASAESWRTLYENKDFSFAALRTKKSDLASFGMTAAQFKELPPVSRIRDIRNQAKDIFSKEIAPILSVPPSQWLEETRAMQPAARVLSELTLAFSKAYIRRKKKEAVMDFNDLEHYALDILLDRDNPDFDPMRAREFPSQTALALRSRYREVMIDEYQDTNGVQELITSLLSDGKNRFMVGDIKQSIYRFRQADPTIFLEKYNTYTHDPASLTYRIDLNRNFRSDACVLASINFLFRQILSEQTLELSYGKEEALYPGRKEDPRPANYLGGPVSIELIDSKSVRESEDADPVLKEIQSAAAEGRLIAEKIRTMMEEKQQVMNKDGTFRPVAYGDIVILLRSVSSKGPVLLKTLEENGIPAVSDREDDFVRNNEVQVLWALLKILDNPLQDLPLTAVLRSFFVGLDEKDLSLLYLLKKKEKADFLWPLLEKQTVLSPDKTEALLRFLRQYGSWRESSLLDGIAPLLRKILADSDYLTYISGLPGGAFRKSHVLSFYALARARDAGTHNGLYPFLNDLSRLTKISKEFRSRTASAASDAVRIMTIHRSKGLEFPVVFLADTAKPFNLRDSQAAFLLHKELGLGLQYYDKPHHARWPSLYWTALKSAIQRESRAEEARLLYVAMTRARDKLFLIGLCKDAGQDLDRWAASLFSSEKELLPAHITGDAKSYLDWIMPAVLRHRSMEPVWNRLDRIPRYLEDGAEGQADFLFHVTDLPCLFTEEEKALWNHQPRQSPEKQAAPDPLADYLSSLPPPPDWMDRQLTWSYPHPGAVETPSKLTATAAVSLRERQEYAAAEEPPFPSVLLVEDGDSSVPCGTPGDAADVPQEEMLPPDYSTPPAFLTDEKERFSGGTPFGTLMHKAMELLDFTKIPADKSAFRREIERLGKEQFFTKEETRILLSTRHPRHPLDALLAFAAGPLAKLMKRAVRIRKEMPFSILLPAHSFYPQCEEEEKIFLQGVMDCLLEGEKGLIIIDYKTDRLMTEEQLRRHYREQLLVYREAGSTLLGKPVLGLFLWSFELGKAIRIE